MKTSAEGRAFIKRHEGLELTAYRDPVGIWTIGYGNTGSAAYEGNRITEREAELLLTEDLRDAESAINRLVKVKLNQTQFDALASFVFNVGVGAFAKSTLLRELNAGRYERVDDELRRWVYGTANGRRIILPGLVKRRSQEAVLWQSAAAVVDEGPQAKGEAGVVAEPPPAQASKSPAVGRAAGFTFASLLAPLAQWAGSREALAVFVVLGIVALGVTWIRSRNTG